jgi:transcriptional regulator with XRE-family HTH domain
MARRQKREKLKAQRHAAGLSQRQLAERVGVTIHTVRAWEQGRALPFLRHHEPLRTALGIPQAELVHLLNPSAPVELNGHRVPRWLNTYESLVLEAGWLGEVELSAIPALLQTKAYGAAVERAGELSFTEHEVIERIDVRAERQKVLDRQPDPLQLVAVLGEGVLRDPVGGGDVMVEQCDHLIELADRPNVEIRILGPGRTPSAIGGFELLARRDDPEPFMAVTADVTGPRYEDRPELVDTFAARFNHLLATALNPSETARRIRDIQETHR